MTTLSTRIKEAIKTSLAIVIAYWIAMSMGWDKPYWAGFTVVTINILSSGISITRGMMRTFGTIFGAVAGLIIMGLFPQDRWLLMACLSLSVGFGTYMLTGKSKSYFWFLVALTCLIVVGVNSPPNSETAFQVALLRTQETALGALVYILIAAFLWPISSVDKFNKISCQLLTTQFQLYKNYWNLMSIEGTVEDSRSLRLQEVQQFGQIEQLLNAAESDSYEVWAMRGQWRHFLQQSTALKEVLERWRQSFVEIQECDLSKLVPNLETINSELTQRFEQITLMLAGTTPTKAVESISVAVDKVEMRNLSSFQEAAVVVTMAQLENIDRLSHSLFACIADIKGYQQQVPKPVTNTASRRKLAIDPDRIKAGARVILTLWIAYLIWIYVNPPGHSLFPMMAGIFALIIVMLPKVSNFLLFISWGGGVIFAGLLYVFIMPHLSGFSELAIMLFVAFFLMHYVLGKPQNTLARIFAMSSFLILINIDNQQSYSFAEYANGVLWIMLSLLLAIITSYIPCSPRPEKVFLRLLSRFFHHAEFLVEDISRKKSIITRMKTILYQNDLLEVPRKLWAYSNQIDYKTFNDNTQNEVQSLVVSLYSLAFRLKDLVEAQETPQSKMVQEHLLDDLLAWHQVIEERFKLRGKDPTIDPIANVRNRLADRLSRLESHIKQVFLEGTENDLNTDDYKNMLLLLGSYRGLSEAAIGYAEHINNINWSKWKEERF